MLKFSHLPCLTFHSRGSDKNAPHSQDHRFTSPSGIESYVLIEVSTVERNHGDEIGLCLRLRDRTALRNALDKSEEHFALFETLDLAMGKGQGSTFTFMLPPQERSRPSLKKIGFSASPTRFANRDVLIVDDEAPIRAILARHLAVAGFNVHLASNGEQALTAVEEIRPALHLVIMDITMPGLSGIETWSHLRKTHRGQPLRRIGLKRNWVRNILFIASILIVGTHLC